MKYGIYDIEWDVDEEDEATNLPSAVTMGVDVRSSPCDTDGIADELADWLMDTYGFEVYDFKFYRMGGGRYFDPVLGHTVAYDEHGRPL